MTLWEAAVLGVIQGLTEFLPISSTAHLLVARTALGHPHPEDAFTVVVQLGTLAAVFVYFRADVVRLARGLAADFAARRPCSNPDGRTAWMIAFGTLPVVAVGGLGREWIRETFQKDVTTMAWVAVVFAVLMAAAEVWARARRNVANPGRGETDVGWLDAAWMGVWQALALMPGASRSGTTITAGLFTGLTRSAAARFSFLLSLPAILAAGTKELYGELKKLRMPDPESGPSLFASGDDVAALLVGTLVSAVVGYLSIAWLLHFLKRYSTAVFVAYRLVFAAVLLVAARVYGW